MATSKLKKGAKKKKKDKSRKAPPYPLAGNTGYALVKSPVYPLNSPCIRWRTVRFIHSGKAEGNRIRRSIRSYSRAAMLKRCPRPTASPKGGNDESYATQKGVRPGGVAMAVVSAFPRIAHAQVDPVTYLQAAAAAVSIISNILGLSDNDAELEKKLDVINSKLDLIIANQAAVIAEIHGLRIYINEAFYQSWVSEYSRDIKASRDLHRIYATRPVNARAKTALETIALDCSRTTLKIGNANFLVFPSYAMGIGVVLSIHRLLRTPRQLVAAARKEFEAAVDFWLDKDNPDSIVSTIARLVRNRRPGEIRSTPSRSNLTRMKAGRANHGQGAIATTATSRA
jgi:hypothetical protein